MKYELEIISDIVLTVGNKTKTVSKNDCIKKIFDLETVEIEEYVDPKNGKHIKKYTSVYQNNIYYKVNKPYEEVKHLVLNRTAPVLGFISKSKRYKHGQV
jgi:hypothetical protein